MAAPDPWVRWSWVGDHAEEIRLRVVEHLQLTGLTMVVAVAIALPLGVACYRSPRLYGPVLGVTGILYTIPSLALLALLIPFTGLTTTTAVIPLVCYSLLVLVRNVVVGLQSVPDDVKESARGMGFSPGRQLLRIEVPLALPAVFAGLRVATVTVLGLVTVPALIGQGGLGQLILDGLYRDFRTPLVVGVVLVAALSVALDLGLVGLQWLLMPWARRGRS